MSVDSGHDEEGTASTREVDQAMADLGMRIREARSAQGLRVRELARRVGVSASFLSQFERGQSRATVSTLFAIARELGLSLDSLLGNRSGGVAETVDEAIPPVAEYLDFQTGVRWRHLVETDNDGAVQFLYTEYETGADSAPIGSPQTHRGQDYGYILEGILTVETSDSRRTFGAGEAIHLDGTKPHRLRNESSGTVRAIWLVVE